MQVYQTLNPRCFPTLPDASRYVQRVRMVIFSQPWGSNILLKKKFHALQEYTCKVHSCDLNFSLQELHTSSICSFLLFSYISQSRKCSYLSSFSPFRQEDYYLSFKMGLLMPLLWNLIYVILISSLPIQNIGCVQCDPITWDISAKQHSIKHCTYLLTHASFPIRLWPPQGQVYWFIHVSLSLMTNKVSST